MVLLSLADSDCVFSPFTIFMWKEEVSETGS